MTRNVTTAEEAAAKLALVYAKARDVAVKYDLPFFITEAQIPAEAMSELMALRAEADAIKAEQAQA